MKNIIGYENCYKVTKDGRVWSTKSNKFLKPITANDGVQKVTLYKEGKKKKKAIHRLVAEAYIANLGNKPQVDHIDGNKQNNKVENLRWCTNIENQAFRDKQLNSGKEYGGNKRRGKQVKWGEEVYPSIGELARVIATERGSKVATVKKELKAARYKGKVVYGKWCEIA